MSSRFVVAGILALILLSGARPQTPAPSESHRLRIVNREDGAIEVSTDSGATWKRIGRVVRPATSAAEGHLAADYAPQGAVAAVAVHGLRVRVSGPDPVLHAPRLLSILPAEYGGGTRNKGFGGVTAGAAGIETDIAAGTTLFRDLAPLVGNPVYLEADAGRLVPLPADFLPSGTGETIVIPVAIAADPLVTVQFENRRGGAVTGFFQSGALRRLATVVQPVRGVGRFDGTAYTGVGRINTTHTGVITVGTAPVDASEPEGVGRERRGGFQISPAWHNSRCEEAGAPMVMTLADPEWRSGKPTRALEGAEPLFSGQISLAGGPQAAAECRIDNGSWEPLPTLRGALLDSLTGPGLTAAWKRQGIVRRSADGLTELRLRLPRLSPALAAELTEIAAQAFQARRLAAARAGRIPLVSGVVSVNANPTNRTNVAYVRLKVDGKTKGFTNVHPYTLSWDTRLVPDGEYTIEADALDSTGAVLTTTRKRVYVLNATKDVVSQGSGAS